MRVSQARPGEDTMIVNFSTRFDRLTMFAEPARALLRMLGHSGVIPGAILATDLAPALASLRAGLERCGQEPSPAPSADEPVAAAERDRAREPVIDLSTRAVPLIGMIERAMAGGSDLMWDRG
jgi:hypothetical protein